MAITLNKKTVGLLAGIIVLALVWVAPLNALGEIGRQGQQCLALTLMTVVWWACGVAQPAYVSAIYLVLLIVLISVIIHMFMGSVMAVLGICIPAFLAFTSGSGVTDLAVAMMVFSAINIHYILPFHNLAILVGEGPDAAGYTSKDAMRMGIPLTVVVFVVVLVEAAWFHLLGIM